MNADANPTVEGLSVELARKIREQPDYQDHEHVGVVYRGEDGSLKATELYTKQSYISAPLGKATQAAGGTDNVVAVVHNHPVAIVDAAEERAGAGTAEINKLPSNNDWNTAKDLFGSRQDVSYYVLGPDDALRRYEYKDREAWDKKNEYSYRQNNERRYEAGPTVEIPPAPKARRLHGDKVTRADAVVLSLDPQTGERGRNVFLIQGELSDPANLRSQAATQTAAATPVQDSFAKLQALDPPQAPSRSPAPGHTPDTSTPQPAR